MGMNKDVAEQMEIRTDIPKPRNTIYSKYIKRLLDILLRCANHYLSTSLQIGRAHV